MILTFLKHLAEDKNFPLMKTVVQHYVGNAFTQLRVANLLKDWLLFALKIIEDKPGSRKRDLE